MLPHIQTSSNLRCSTQNTKMFAEDSADTVRTSLDVNTSIDVINENGGSNDKYMQKDYKRKHYNASIANKQQYNSYSTDSENKQDSISTTCTSLQVNTSLDTSSRLQLRRSNDKNRMSVLTNTMYENKNIKENTDTTNVCRIENTRRNEDFIDGNASNNNRHIEQDYPKILDKIQDASNSYIEVTPYPMSRSVLLKSQLKQNANNFQNNKYKSRKCSDSESSFTEVSGTHLQATVIIQESSGETELEEDVRRRNSIALTSRRKCKKKLLPLRQSSQLLSFSPVQEKCLPPEQPTFTRKHKKRKKYGKKNKFNVTNDTSNVKHIDTNNEFHDTKKEKKSRKVISKKILIKKIIHEDIVNSIEKDREKVRKLHIDACTSNRSSSNDFQPLKMPSGTQLQRRKLQRINIVTTGLSNEDKSIVKSVVKVLGFAKIESNVTKRTTHVVTTGVRTINLLHGIIRGCWLVSLEWILKSLESNAWLDPEEFEMLHFSKAVLENRKDRQLFGSSYVPELFATCGCMYIRKDTIPPCNILKDLIKTAGGRITENPETAKIIIGAEGLKETWILDCITTGDIQSYTQYQHH